MRSCEFFLVITLPVDCLPVDTFHVILGESEKISTPTCTLSPIFLTDARRTVNISVFPKASTVEVIPTEIEGAQRVVCSSVQKAFMHKCCTIPALDNTPCNRVALKFKIRGHIDITDSLPRQSLLRICQLLLWWPKSSMSTSVL